MTGQSRLINLFLVFVLLALSPCHPALISVNASPGGEIIWAQSLNLSETIDDRAMKVTIDDSGIYVAGFDVPSGLDIQWRIMKRNLTDGSSLWGQTSNPSSGIDLPSGIAVDSSGVYIVGYGTDPSLHSLWRIEKRSLADGTLISSFGTGGVISEDLSSGNDYATSIAVDSSGIYVVGYDTIPGDSEWRFEKRDLTTGSIIWTQTSNPSADFDAATSVTLDSSAMYVAGYDKVPGNSEWRIEKRSLTSGSLVAAFGTGGVITENPSSTDDAASKIIAHSSGLYISGYDSSPGTGTQWRIEKRSLTDGSASWTQLSRGGLYAKAYGVAVDDSGAYIVGDDDAPGNQEWRIEKRSLTSGNLLPTFGTAGLILSNPGSGDDLAYDIAFDSSGIYVVGYDSVPGDKEWRIEKRDPARPASKLIITVYPSSVAAGSWTSMYQVQRRDYYDNPVTAGSTLVELTSTSSGAGRRFAETSGGAEVTSITIPDGSSTKDFYYYDDAAGSCTIAVTSSDLVGDGKPLTISPRSGCVIATAAYDSEMAPEVAYMRHVRDGMIGSNEVGRMLVDGWNVFYYSWSPPLAQFISTNAFLKPTLRILLLPLVGMVHVTASTYESMQSVDGRLASVIAFVFAAVSLTAIYVAIPLLTLRTAYERRFSAR